MISGIVFVERREAGGGRPDRLARSLSALVPGVVEGLFGDVVVVGSEISPGDRTVADHAGCRVIEGDEALGEAVARAARSHALVLLAGAVPEEAFVEELGLLMRASEAARQPWLLKETRSGGWLRLGSAVLGVLAPRQQLAAIRKADFARLTRIRPARTLKTRARQIE